MRMVAVSDHIVDAQLTLTPPASKAPAPAAQTQSSAATFTSVERSGGPPYFWIVTVDRPVVGTWRVALTRSEACAAQGASAPIAQRTVTVLGRPLPSLETPRTALWASRFPWSRSFENLYSAWIEHLFDAPLDATVSYAALHEVLRDRERNFLFDYTGNAEDEQGVVVRPDCADLPYFLRAYFSFKLGLPFGWSHCLGGEGGKLPVCGDFATNSDPFAAPTPDAGAPAYETLADPDRKARTLQRWADPARDATGPWEVNVKRLGEFFRTILADEARSASGRTPPDDETSDYYPVALSVEALRPGTVYADPYGHVLVLAKRIPQTSTSGGVLLAVDGQPDGTVARKRFWRGNFLFSDDPALGGPGFKRFRPVVREPGFDAPLPDDVTVTWRHLKNHELSDYSRMQYKLGIEGFYDKMDDVLSPAPLDPTQALLETIQALEEQVKTRVVSVENGRKFLASGKPPAEMPEGARIFETQGDWEDFSTPSRDLRLLIAIDVARGIPARVVRRPERYAMPAGKNPEALRGELEARLARELETRTFKYVRTDGSEWELHLKDVVDRQTALEMAYNPNECAEHRWGAPDGSPEAATCTSHAPDTQVSRMETYRSWFHDRRRPGR
jgi:hypothetical protein